MTTSGTTAWSLTAQEIIDTALVENRIIGPGRSATSRESTECLKRLNGILKSWRGAGHLVAQADVTVPANDPSGTLPDYIYEITAARLVVSATYERELSRYGRTEYMSLPNKATSGEPVLFYAENQRESPALYVWPVPTTQSTVRIDYTRMPETVTALTQTVDWPEEYNEVLFTNLAVRCAGIFGRQPNPELIDRAGYLRRIMEDDERPESYYMEGV